MATKHLSTDFVDPSNTINITKPISRFDSKPLDCTGLYDTLTAAQTYATNDVHAHVGQIVSVISDTSVTSYQIKDTTGSLREYAYREQIALKPVVSADSYERPIILGGNADNSSWDADTLYYAAESNKITANPAIGQIKASSFNAISDARLKENFTPLYKTNILQLPLYKFDFKDGQKNQIGCKAQDLKQICPELVTEGSDGYLSIQESKIVYLLIDELRELKSEIDFLKLKLKNYE